MTLFSEHFGNIPKCSEVIRKIQKRETNMDTNKINLLTSLKDYQNHPIFLNVRIKDRGAFTVTFLGTTTEEVEEDFGLTHKETYFHFRIISENERGKGISVPKEDILFLEKTRDKDEDMWSREYQKTMLSIHTEITTFVYPEVSISPDFDEYKRYLINIDPIREKKYLLTEVKTLDDARKWVLRNHPEEYIGMCVKVNNGDFIAGAILQAYGDGNFETCALREEYIKREAKKLGISPDSLVFSWEEVKNAPALKFYEEKESEVIER